MNNFLAVRSMFSTLELGNLYLGEAGIHTIWSMAQKSMDTSFQHYDVWGLNTLMAAETAADSIQSERWQSAFQICLKGLPNGGQAAGIENLYTGFVKSHQWPPSHTASQKFVYSMICQKLHRGQTAALFMGRIVHSCYVFRAVFADFHNGVKVAMSKVIADFGLQAARGVGRNGYFNVVHRFSLSLGVSQSCTGLDWPFIGLSGGKSPELCSQGAVAAPPKTQTPPSMRRA
jgi:hypothetical protein